MGKRVNRFVKEPFVNLIGQVIHPGDKVLCVAQNWRGTHVFQGTYSGVNKGGNRRYDWNQRQYISEGPEEIQSVRVDNVYFQRKRFDWSTKETKDVQGYRVSTLPRKMVFKVV